MATEQSAASSKREAMTDGARYVVGEVVREPVKDAVREAIDEQTVVVRSDGSDASASSRGRSTDSSESADRGGDDSGGSKIGPILVGVAAAVGAAYLVRRRRSDTEQSTWSEFEDEGAEHGPAERGRTEHVPGEPNAGAGAVDESHPSSAANE
jgi:hypothetical protein